MEKVMKVVKIDPNNPNFGALLIALKQLHKELPESVRKRWMQSIIAAATNPVTLKTRLTAP
jgi:hypothetical protein